MSVQEPQEGLLKQDVDACDQKLSLEQQKVIQTDLRIGDQKEIVSPGSEGPGQSIEVLQPPVEPLSIPMHCTSITRRPDSPQTLALQPVPHSRTTTTTATTITIPDSNEEMEKDMVQAEQEQDLILQDIRTAMHQVAQTIRQRHMQLTKVNASLLRVLQDNAALRRDMAAMGKDMAAQNNRITAIQGDILGVQRAMKDMITRVSEIITIQAQAAVAALFPIPSTALEVEEEEDTPQPLPEPLRPKVQHQSFPPFTAASGNLHVPAVPPRATAVAPIGSYYSISGRRIRPTKASWRADKPYARGRGGRGGWGRGNGY